MFLASYDQPEIVEHQANVLEVAKHCGVQHVVRLKRERDWAPYHLMIMNEDVEKILHAK